MKKNPNLYLNSFYKDITITTVIITLPFLFYTYNLFPQTQIWGTPFFTFSPKYFQNTQYFVHSLNIKIYILLLLSLWFLTCKHWWRFAILIPFSIEFHKLIGVLNTDIKFNDGYGLIGSIPITLLIITILFFISRKLNYYNRSKSLNSELNDEISELLNELSHFKKKNYNSLKNDLSQLRKNKQTMQKDEYLKSLIRLRNKI